MLKYFLDKLPRKTQTAMQDPATENCSQKYSSDDVRIMYVIR